MKFDVYCDESRPDLLSSHKPKAAFMVIGSLWLHTEDRSRFKDEIHELRDRHKIGGEFKWGKISPSRESFYSDLVDWFFAQGERLRFRCIAVDREKVNLKLYHDDDQELGFYKFYYQMLHHWILDFNEYNVFLDFKSNRRRDRLPVLQRCLSLANLSSRITSLQSIRSNESVLLQLADVLTGAASWRLNDHEREESVKMAVVNRIETHLGRPLKPTHKGEQKFNIFRIDLHGGW